jgi:CheY-like chemotaxis protein
VKQSAERAPPSSRKDPPSSSPASSGVRRILVIDDNPAIHDDFRKILCPRGPAHADALDAMEAELFGSAPVAHEAAPPFVIYAASQGREGYDVVSRMMRGGQPITLAFVDMRMPPGWDGVETTAKLLSIDPALEVAICSAFSDYSWNEVITTLRHPELRFLRKPFEAREVLDLAWSLTSRALRRRGARG